MKIKVLVYTYYGGYYLMYLFIFVTGSHYVSLAGLLLTMETRLACVKFTEMCQPLPLSYWN